MNDFSLWKNARCWSIAMHRSILFLHLVSTAEGVCSVPCITLSHLRTQIRCIDSDSRICRSLDKPLFGERSPTGGRVRLPQLRSTPRFSVGHGTDVSGQKCFARVQILSVIRWLHSRRMCSRDSREWSQLEQWACCSKVGMLVQKLPMQRALLMALYRKACIGHQTSWCLQPFQMLWLCRDISKTLCSGQFWTEPHRSPKPTA